MLNAALAWECFPLKKEIDVTTILLCNLFVSCGKLNRFMKKLLLVSICYLFSIIVWGQASDKQIAIIPEPVKMVQSDGIFQLPNNISIEAPTVASLQPALLYLKDRLALPTGYKVSVSEQSANAQIRLRLLNPVNGLIGKEGYLLNVTPNMVTISANE